MRSLILLLGTVSAFMMNKPFSLSSRSMVLNASATTPSEIIKESVATNKVMLFSKSYCPFCDKAKTVFDKMNVEYGAIELDKVNDGSEIQAELLAMTGQRTVPSVWINSKHIGGCDDTLKLYSSGGLEELVR